jgi:hypothetical protein
MIAVRSVLGACAGVLAVMGCASTGHENGDPRGDDPDGTTQEPTVPVCSGGVFTCKSRVRVDEHNRIKPFATPAGFGPADLVSAYKLNPAITSTATIAIVDAFHYANAESDLATYRSQFGLAPCTKANGCLSIVNQNGAAAPLPAAPPPGDDWNLEAALDLDMASAACPTCKIVLVEAQDDTSNGLFVAQNAAAALPGVASISDSWGAPSSGAGDLTLDAQFFTHPQNVNVFVSSGDSGNTGAAGDYPSTSEHVIAVGGTHLVKSATARGWTETAWSGAGSTCSAVFAEPAFQKGAVPTTACTMRAAADISAVADPNTGVAVFNANDGGFIIVGGTSASSPFAAGVFARYGVTAASHDASFVYAHTAQFFDVTAGSNGSCGTALCNAGPGWDGPTGVGSLNGSALDNGGACGCNGKACGDDGCGNSCGSCASTAVCTSAGQCCTPQCSGKNCGPDGCGGTCGTCGPGQACSANGTCTVIPCAHPICSGGAQLTTTCDPCAAEVCAADAFCCNTAWDSICVGEVTSVCHQTCGSGPCEHALCVTGSKLTPSCDSCAGRICAADPYCCNNTWDAQCVSAVVSLCHESCD